MSQFISKLQYKTFEKGEFSDEQTRDLEQTLSLIKSFPWDMQRGVDVQLTGPGVVIVGALGDYLKIGLFYSGKFSVYYLNADNHLYEYHTDDLNEACGKVNDFFSGNLNIEDWEKHFFNIGNRAHLLTQAFEYRINATVFYARFGLMVIVIVFYLLMCIVFFVLRRPVLAACLFLSFGSLFTLSTAMLLRIYFRSKNLVLQISKGTNEFKFGDNVEQKVYLKSEITQINMYGHPVGRSKQLLTIMEISFNNGRIIKFPGLLIDPIDLLAKLSEKVPINYLEQNSLFRKSVWEY